VSELFCWKRAVVALALLSLVFFPQASWSQISDVTESTSVPIPGAGHNYLGMLNETVDPAGGSVSLRIGTAASPGRGLTLPFSFAYDTNGVHFAYAPGAAATWHSNLSYFAQGGWAYSMPLLGSITVEYQDPQTKNFCFDTKSYMFEDSTGGRHPLSRLLTNSGAYYCHLRRLSDYEERFQISLSGGTRVVDEDGTVYAYTFAGLGCAQIPTSGRTDPYPNPTKCLPSSIEDRNGNQLSIAVSNPVGAFTVSDTLGRTALSSSGFGTTGNTVSVAGLGGSYAVTWGTASSNFASTWTQVAPDPNNRFCSPANGDIETQPVITAITLPNGQQYRFSYDPTYGEISKITYPSGGSVSYQWGINPQSTAISFYDVTLNGLSCFYRYDRPALLHRYVSFDGVTTALHQDFSYSTTWGAADSVYWASKQTVVTTHDLLRGTVFQTVYAYVPLGATPGSEIPVEQSVTYKDMSGATLRTVSKTWLDQYKLSSEKTTLDNGLSSQVTYTYGSPSGACTFSPSCQLIEKDEYDFGQSTPSRKTVTNYQTFAATPIYSSTPSIFNLPCQVVVSDGSVTPFAETDNFYDNGVTTTPCGAAGTPTAVGAGGSSLTGHDITNYAASSTAPRGNLTTTVKKCLQAGCTSPSTSFAYDETGQIVSVTDPNENVSNYSYADNYTVLSAGANVFYTPTGTTNAFLTKITDPVSHTQSFSYDFNNGQLTSTTDQNGLVKTYVYNDLLARPTLATRPDGGQTTLAYNDAPYNASTPSPSITTTSSINGTTNMVDVSAIDGLGHAVKHLLTSDPQGTVETDTTYDGIGRVLTASNPYRGGSDPTTSLGTTTYFYDALGRKCVEVPPDGTLPTGGGCPTTQPTNTIFTVYSGNSTTVTDQDNRSRKSVTDGLGRVTQVFEAPGIYDYETDYTYNALDKLLSVNQKGGTTTNSTWRTRTFTYDSLGRLLTSNNPEVGTITYKYDADTNCTAPNLFVGLLVSKTDARNIRTCAQYDTVNRQVALNYSNGDTAIKTTYDGTACLGLTNCQNIGYRTSMTDGAGSESWAYQTDKANSRSIHVNQRTTKSGATNIKKNTTYYLDLAGNTTRIIYPTGRNINYTYDAANRPSTSTDGPTALTYATGFATPPAGCLAGAVCYTPQGSVYAMSLGQTSSFTGLNLSHTYNTHLQPLEFKASSTAGTAMDLTYFYDDILCISSCTHYHTGHLHGLFNQLDATRSQGFVYDYLNRLVAAQTNSTYASNPTHCWGETYGVDAWGNLSSIAPTTDPQYTGCTQESGMSAPPDGNNHLTGLSYDASGNTQSDGLFSYTWNAESQIKAAAGVTYVYDGNGRRVSKSSGKLYWYGSGDEILAETDGTGATTAEYVFFGGKRVAMRPASGNPIFYVEDMLGTSRVITTNTGVVCYDADYYPYGGERSYTNTCPQNYKFEGKERDAETGNDDFGARYYSSRFGRWLSSDWSSTPEAVPYANLTNPQTLNLYAMVADDPESFADLDGHGTACDGDPEKCTSHEPTLVKEEHGRIWDFFHALGWVQSTKELADQARKNLAGVKNITINGTTFQDFLKTATDQQVLTAQRAIVEFLSAEAASHPCGYGVDSCGIIIPPPIGGIGAAFAEDYATAATVNESATYASEGEARAIARTKLGSDAVEVAPGKWRSANGKWQYRAKPGDVAENHIHLERLNPQTGEVIYNLHLRWPEGTGR